MAADICRTGKCNGCPYHGLYTAGCVTELIKDVFGFINRQKAEKEMLKKRNTLLLKKKCKDINTARKIIKSEAIKEFAERLKNKNVQGFWDENAYISVDDIDNLAKEMAEVQE